MDYLPLGGRRRGFTPRVSVSFSITHRCVVLVFASLFPYLRLLFFAVDVILIGLDCLSILFIACVHFPHTLCLSWSLNWYFYFGVLNVHSVFYTIWTFNISHWQLFIFFDGVINFYDNSLYDKLWGVKIIVSVCGFTFSLLTTPHTTNYEKLFKIL